jgi:carbonic anhydrase
LIQKSKGFALAAILGSVSLSIAGCSTSAEPVASPSESVVATPAAWSYEGANGPENWGTLDPTYVTCVDGTAQSPIDITSATSTDLENITFNYVAGEAGVFNNGHTVEAEPMVEGEDTITLDGTTYPFLQFHFHAPSEHAVNGENYPLEVHFVHKTEDGQIAVVGVFVEEGETNEAWQPFIDLISSATEDPEANLTELDWASMLPAEQTTYRYDGSLTTPGCAEGVKWNVMTNPITMSADQIAAFVGAYSNNARPTQPLNGREILEDSTK